MAVTLHSIHPYDSMVGAMATTVRRGEKWFNEGDRELDLCHCQQQGSYQGEPLIVHEVVGTARIINRVLMQFRHLTDRMVADEHEESSRTVAGLLESMRRAYGDEFGEDEFVTVLRYWRTS